MYFVIVLLDLKNYNFNAFFLVEITIFYDCFFGLNHNFFIVSTCGHKCNVGNLFVSYTNF